MAQPQPPNVSDFTAWVRSVMGIATAYLPDGSASFTYAFDAAVNVVNTDIGCLPAQQGSFSPYQLAVFNLGGHLLVEYAPDASYPVVGASWANGQATLVTGVPHSIVPGDKLTVAGISPNGYNSNSTKLGYFVAGAVPDDTHLSYAVGANPGAPVVTGSSAVVSEQYFMAARRGFKMSSFVPGPIGSASDLSTAAGFLNPEFMRGLTLENLQLLKTPWGRSYLSIAQKYGPNIWGIS